MADARPAHYTVPKSLMNIPTEPFEGPGRALYGPRGPMQPHNTGAPEEAAEWTADDDRATH